MDKIQILFFFLISYLISRLFVKVGLPQRILFYLIEKKHVSLATLSFYLIMTSALLSTILANVITVLTMLPLVITILETYQVEGRVKQKVATLLSLSLIYGSNIGGIGSITGTTTNGLLLGLLEGFRIQGVKQLTYLSWLLWGTPLIIILSCVGWILLVLFFRPWQLVDAKEIHTRFDSKELWHPHQRITTWIGIIFVISSAVLSFLINFNYLKLSIFVVSSLWTAVFLYCLFMMPIKGKNGTTTLLKRDEILHDLPQKGILWVLLGVGLTALLYYFKVPHYLAHEAADIFRGTRISIGLILTLGLLSTFASEFLSNSAIQMSFFFFLFPLTKTIPFINYQPFLVVTLCSTCAFMTPLATPANGLGYGGIKGVSLWRMMLVGIAMNLASVIIISLGVYYLVPFVLQWF